MRILKWMAAGAALSILAACSTTYTVDDGRKVDEKLLQQMRTYAEGTQALRPAVVRSAQLHDPDCSTQWEIPFEVVSSYGYSKDDRVAWVRAGGFDEHLRVLASSPVIDLRPGDIIAEVDGYRSRNTTKMAREVIEKRDDGKPFDLKMEDGRLVHVAPFKVCRGRTIIQPPGKNAEKQDYHWLQSYHPEEVAAIHLTPDEAQWVVLFTQGVSEEGGFRMKSYTYGMAVFKTAAQVALMVTTAGTGNIAANAAFAAGSSISGAIAAGVAAEVPGLVAMAATAAAANVASLHGVSWVASTAFDKADTWAFVRMQKLGIDPTAGTELQTRLVAAHALHNAFLMDDERQKQMATLTASIPEAQRPATAEAIPSNEVESTNLTETNPASPGQQPADVSEQASPVIAAPSSPAGPKPLDTTS